MKKYEVTYEVDGEIRTENVLAEGPVDANRRFVEAIKEKGAVVFCIVLQQD